MVTGVTVDMAKFCLQLSNKFQTVAALSSALAATLLLQFCEPRLTALIAKEAYVRIAHLSAILTAKFVSMSRPFCAGKVAASLTGQALS